MSILGIDPGLSGGIARRDQYGLLVEPMPIISVDGKSVIDIPVLVRWIRAHQPIRKAYVEKVAPMPKNGSIGCFKLGDTFGIIKGILATMEIPTQLVPPQAWQKTMLAGIEGTGRHKGRSCVAASRLFPETDFRASDRCRFPHDGMVEAALIADYGFRLEAKA